jgi:hypothetical protein
MVTGVPHCWYMRYHRAYGMILVDLDESYQNIPKSTNPLCPKMCHNMGSKIVFFSFAPKRHFSQDEIETIHNCNTTRRGLPESPSYDLT